MQTPACTRYTGTSIRNFGAHEVKLVHARVHADPISPPFPPQESRKVDGRSLLPFAFVIVYVV